MELVKTLRGLSCALLIGLSANQLSAIDTNKPNFGTYTYFYTEKKSRYLEINEKDSKFSFRVVDTDSDNKAGSVRLLDNGKDMTFRRRNFTLEDSIKEIQLFDIADKFLEYFSNKPKKSNPLQVEKFNQYIELVKERFLEKRKVEERVNYDFNKFFSEGFKPQETAEDLIMYSYVKYSGLIREAKLVNPKQTFQSLLDNSNLWDKFRFERLSKEYGNNLKKLKYRFERFPFPKEDFLEINLFDESRAGKDLPYLKIEMNMNSIPDTVDIAEIRNFLNGKKRYLFKYDKKGNYLYGGFRCKKQLLP